MRATGPHRLAPSDDPVSPGATTPITVQVDGCPVIGLAGQTIAGILLSAGRASWRTTRTGRPRGIFCGIGICYDCLLTVNGLRDVRACQRRAADGDIIITKSEISGGSAVVATHESRADACEGGAGGREGGADAGYSAEHAAGPAAGGGE